MSGSSILLIPFIEVSLVCVLDVATLRSRSGERQTFESRNGGMETFDAVFNHSLSTLLEIDDWGTLSQHDQSSLRLWVRCQPANVETCVTRAGKIGSLPTTQSSNKLKLKESLIGSVAHDTFGRQANKSRGKISDSLREGRYNTIEEYDTEGFKRAVDACTRWTVRSEELDARRISTFQDSLAFAPCTGLNIGHGGCSLLI